MELTKEYQPYNGDYEKKMQDIKLKNGREALCCWPNAGMWHVGSWADKMKGTDTVRNSDVAETRLTHNKSY